MAIMDGIKCAAVKPNFQGYYLSRRSVMYKRKEKTAKAMTPKT